MDRQSFRNWLERNEMTGCEENIINTRIHSEYRIIDPSKFSVGAKDLQRTPTSEDPIKNLSFVMVDF